MPVHLVRMQSYVEGDELGRESGHDNSSSREKFMREKSSTMKEILKAYVFFGFEKIGDGIIEKALK